MNLETIIWLLYFADVFDTLKVTFFVITIFSLISYSVALIWVGNDINNLEIDKKYYNYENIENEIAEKKKLFKKILKFSIISVLITSSFTIFIPSKNIIYSYAAVKFTKISYQSNKHIPNIINETLKLIDLRLQKEIREINKELKLNKD